MAGLALGAAALALAFAPPPHHAGAVAGRLLLAELVIALLPGLSVFLVLRPLGEPTLFEAVGISVPLSFCVVQALTVLAVTLHIPAAWGTPVLVASVMLLLALAAKVSPPSAQIALPAEETFLAAVMLVLSVFLYVEGAPSLGEPYQHAAIVRRLASIPQLSMDDLMYAPGVRYTHPFPGTHVLMALISQAGGVDPLFLVDKIRAFLWPPALILVYLGARMVFRSSACGFAAVLPALLLLANGAFAASRYAEIAFAQSPPFHPSSVALHVLLAGLFVLAFYYLESRTEKQRVCFLGFFFALAATVTMVHVRETVQFVVYTGSFLVGLLAFKRDRVLLARGLALLLIAALTVLLYALWYRHAVPYVNEITVAMKRRLLWDARNLPLRSLFNSAFLISARYAMGVAGFFAGLNLVMILASPLVFVLYRGRPLALMLGMGIFAFLLILRFPLLWVPLRLLTYHEILLAPVRNVVFFLNLCVGALLSFLAMQLSRFKSWPVAVSACLAVSTVFAVLWKVGLRLEAQFSVGLFDAFVGATLLLYAAAFVYCWACPAGGDGQARVAETRQRPWLSAVALLLLPLTVLTAEPAKSPLGLSGKRVFLTPDALTAGLECIPQNQKHMRIEMTGEPLGERSGLDPNACAPPPPRSLISWANQHLTTQDIVLANVFNPYSPAMFVPVLVAAWPVVGREVPAVEYIFREYHALLDGFLDRHGTQPVFNLLETPAERLEHVRLAGATHLFLDPMYYWQLKPLLDAQPEVYQPLHDQDGWAVFRVTAPGGV